MNIITQDNHSNEHLSSLMNIFQRFSFYDAMTVHVAIVFSRYMVLVLEKRRNIDSRSIGDLFYLTIDELQDIRYFDAQILLLKMLFDYAK